MKSKEKEESRPFEIKRLFVMLLALSFSLLMAGWWMKGNAQKGYRKEKRVLATLSSKHRELQQALSRYRQLASFLKGRKVEVVSFPEYLEKRPFILPFFQEQFRATKLPETGLYLVYSPKKERGFFPQRAVLGDQALNLNWSGALTYRDVKETYAYLSEVLGGKRVVLLRYGPPVVFGVFVEGVETFKSSSPSPGIGRNPLAMGRRNAGVLKR